MNSTSTSKNQIPSNEEPGADLEQYLADGSSIQIHYQYNYKTGTIADIKLTTPQRINSALQPGATIKE